jgi:hypothetical protein
MTGTGAFIITWSSHNQDGNGWGVYAQRYDAAGNPLGGEFRVNTTTQDDQMYSRAAVDGSGDFVVTWSSHNQDGNGWGVYAQWFNTAGVAQGGEFRVNTTTTGDQEYSTVAMDGGGNFLVTWSSNNQDGNGWGVYAQQYTAGGAPLGNEFQVNTTTSGNQQYSSVALDGKGDAVVAWSGNGPGDSNGVFAQRYTTGTGQGTGGLPMVAGDAFDPGGDVVPGGAGAAADTVRGDAPGGPVAAGPRAAHGPGHHPGGHHRPAHPRRAAGGQPALLLRRWFARLSTYLAVLLGRGM